MQNYVTSFVWRHITVGGSDDKIHYGTAEQLNLLLLGGGGGGRRGESNNTSCERAQLSMKSSRL